MKEIVSDFSSAEYWSTRFAKEKSFEWLAGTRALGPVVLRLVGQLARARSSTAESSDQSLGPSATEAAINILHFGCGTSSLGPDLARLLAAAGINAKVVDADYVAEFILTDRTSSSGGDMPTEGDEGGGREVPLLNLNVLDRAQLKRTAPPGGWDLLLDKSTADAISCGPSLPRWREPDIADGENGDGSEVYEPIYVLCENLAAVTRPGGRWLCISYSSTRFDHLKPLSTVSSGASSPSHTPDTTTSELSDAISAWRLVSATPLDGAFTGEPSTVDNGKGEKRVVYAPETNVWAYILERE